MAKASKAVNGLEKAKEIITANFKTNPKTRRLLLANITNAEKLIEEQEERIAIMSKTTPVYSISEGHCRMRLERDKDGYIAVFCVSEEYAKPGTMVEPSENEMPVFGYGLRGAWHAAMIAEAFAHIAEIIDKEGATENVSENPGETD